MSPADRPTTPTEVDDAVLALLQVLDIASSTPAWLSYVSTQFFRPEVRECHINAWLQWKYANEGSVVSGWLIWEHKPSNLVEGHFHSVWENAHGELVDVTPREDREEKVLFVRDPSRSLRLTDYEGRPAIKTYTKAVLVRGKVVSPPRDAVGILTTNLIYEHGLA